MIFKEKRLDYIGRPVEIESLKLQKEEVEEVQWFDLENTLSECKKKNQKFCVPIDGLELIKRYLTA